MMLFLTADHHFSHGQILIYQKETRPFPTVHEMNKAYTEMWNDQVGDKDVVYHLGDFCFKRPEAHFPRLRGRIHVIPGNHDRWLPKTRWGIQTGPHTSLRSASREPVIVHNQICIIKEEGQMVVLCHYPLRSWPHSHYGSWHCHGHVHMPIAPWGPSFNVGVDISGGKLYSWEDIKLEMKRLLKTLEEREKEKQRCNESSQ